MSFQPNTPPLTRRLIRQGVLAVTFGLALGIGLTVNWRQAGHWSNAVRIWLLSHNAHYTATEGLAAAMERVAQRQAELDAAVSSVIDAAQRPDADPAVIAKLAATAGNIAGAMALAQSEAEHWQRMLVSPDAHSTSAVQTTPVPMGVEVLLHRATEEAVARSMKIHEAAEAQQSALRQEADSDHARAEAAQVRADQLQTRLLELEADLLRLREQHGANLQELRQQNEMASHENAKLREQLARAAAEAVELRRKLDQRPDAEVQAAATTARAARAEMQIAWNTVEKGRSASVGLRAQRVRELLGPPSYVTQSSPLCAVWIYQSRDFGQGIVQFGRDGVVTSVSMPAFSPAGPTRK